MQRQSIQTSALATISEQPEFLIEEVVRQRLVRLAELIRKDGAPYPLTAALVNVWVDVFARANVEPRQVESAFDRAERNCRFWPSPAEVLGLTDEARTNAVEEKAALKWLEVRDYIRNNYSPDIPASCPTCELAEQGKATRCKYHTTPRITRRISERTRRAVNAAGGIPYLSECTGDDLVFARKRFIESYIRWEELQQDEYLLPAGEVRDLINECAENKQLPGSDPYQAARERGERYRENLGAYNTILIQLQKESRPEHEWITVTDDRLNLLQNQAADIKAKATPQDVSRAEHLQRLYQPTNGIVQPEEQIQR